MVLKCGCGNFKTVMPWKAAIEKKWICDRCRDRYFRKKLVLETEVETRFKIRIKKSV